MFCSNERDLQQIAGAVGWMAAWEGKGLSSGMMEARTCFVATLKGGRVRDSRRWVEPRVRSLGRLRVRVRAADGKVEPGSLNDEEYWEDLARDMYEDLPSDPAEKNEEEGPKFVYPDNIDPATFFKSTDDEASAWDLWNTSLERDQQQSQEELPQRDPRKETDFWRGAAKEIVTEDSSIPAESKDNSSSAPEPAPSFSPDIVSSSAPTSDLPLEPVWKNPPKIAEDGLPDVSEYAELAQEIYLQSPAETPKPPEEGSSSKFVYPEGVNPQDFFTQDSESKEAWGAWNSALEKEAEQDLEMRDPQKEKDFWRGAAQDISSSITGDSNVPSDLNVSSDEATNIPSDETSQDIWKAARDITADTQALKEKLEEEVQNYNPADEKEPYRDVAKDLLSDLEARRALNETLKKQEIEEPTLDQRQISANEWDPDRDWRRFDDVELELERQKLAIEQASKWRREGVEPTEETELTYNDLAGQSGDAVEQTIRYVDESGRELSPEEVESLMAEEVIFVDETGQRVDMSDLPIPSSSQQGAPTVPGVDDQMNSPVDDDQLDSPLSLGNPPSVVLGNQPTMGRKRFTSSTYGGNRGGIEKDIQELEAQGYRLRDPKADATFWRDAAREVVSDETSSDESNSEVAVSEEAIGEEADDEEAGAEEASVEGASVEEAATEDSSSDSVTASEPSVENDESSPASSAPQGIRTSKVDEGDTSAWSSWVNAQSKWEEGLDNMEARDPKKEVDMWRGAARELTGSEESDEANTGVAAKDWGSGLEEGGDASAWQSWRQSVGIPDETRQQWWNLRGDVAQDIRSPSSASSSAPEFWQGVAKTIKTETENKPESDGERDLGENVNMWIDFAKTVKVEEEGEMESSSDTAEKETASDDAEEQSARGDASSKTSK